MTPDVARLDMTSPSTGGFSARPSRYGCVRSRPPADDAPRACHAAALRTGLVHDSEPEAEYQESLNKARPLSPQSAFRSGVPFPDQAARNFASASTAASRMPLTLSASARP